ncbi:MAG: galactose-1-phosphate uridylyltransferase [Deltaproteobacteria bacterium GWA2_57_13]|nr:MAG: galactose-1-phosphate uridylyltransferase [Deltaproteobacteria bacterium GWA2_57_13]
MPVLRQDPTTKEWIIFATERAKRPDDFIKGIPSRSAEKLPVSSCPFCPGNEAATPPAIVTLPAGQSALWSVRVVPNKFAALVPGRSQGYQRVEKLYLQMGGVGAHEVVIETPEHDQLLALVAEDQLFNVLKAYRERYRTLRQEPWAKLILIFKNQGESSGTSLRHPHSQIVATPVVPREVRQKYAVATAYYDDTGQCIYCDVVKEELRIKEQVLLATDRFVVFHPYASRFPFETWIAPKQHRSAFGDVPDEDLQELAQVLKTTLWKFHSGLRSPDYNYVIHSAPVDDERKSYYLWHLQLIPRLSKMAGFELGSGMAINTVLPEETAKFLRQVV